MTSFSTVIVFGERYRDETTGFEGIADQVSFPRYGEPRVKLRALVSHAPVEHWFDEHALEHRPNSKSLGFGNESDPRRGTDAD